MIFINFGHHAKLCVELCLYHIIYIPHKLTNCDHELNDVYY